MNNNLVFFQLLESVLLILQCFLISIAVSKLEIRKRTDKHINNLLESEMISLCRLYTNVYPCRLSRLYIGTMPTSKSHLDIPKTDVTELIYGWADIPMFQIYKLFYCSLLLFPCEPRANYFSLGAIYYLHRWMDKGKSKSPLLE